MRDYKEILEQLLKRNFKLLGELKTISESYELLCLICDNVSKNNLNNIINKNQGCKYCKGRGRLTDEEIKSRLLKRNIEFLEFIKPSKIKNKCIDCSHIWIAHISNLLYATTPTNCPKCNGTQKITEEEVKAQLLKTNLELISVYIGARDELRYKCLKCGYEGKNSLSNIKHQEQGCPYCKIVGVSKKEDKWLDLVGVPKESRRHKFRFGKRLITVDGFNKETNTVYEFYGDYWHGNPNKYKREVMNTIAKKTFGELYDRTIEREKFLQEKGFKLVTIWENDFNKEVIYDV